MLQQSNYSSDDNITQSRIYIVAIIIVVLICLLGWRLFDLQGTQNDRFSTLAQNNRIQFQSVAPVRGLIYDRNGQLLAENLRTFNLQVQPDRISDVTQTIAQLREFIDISEQDITRFEDFLRTRPKFELQTLKINLSEDEVARFAVNQYRFPGIQLNARLQRSYAQKELVSHVLGYVGRISTEELKRIDAKLYQGADYIGKNGIEQRYEELLFGQPGYEQVEVNAHGQVVRRKLNTPAETGAALHLSLDIELQKKSYEALKGYRGAVVALDPSTGDILSFVSTPSYDANLFVNGISSKDYSKLQQNSDKPLLNRALYGRYSPGSTIKGFLSLVGMDEGISFDSKIFCPGWFSLPNTRHRYRCWKKSGHGLVDGKQAIIQSCDVYYYQLANRLGIDKIYSGMSLFGFGRVTGVDLYNEPSGLMPSRQWKKRVHKQPWYQGETVITGIGQGYTLITPLQLATTTALLANRGGKVTPRFLVATENPQTQVMTNNRIELVQDTRFSSNQYEQIIDSMRQVVHGSRGTARRISKGIQYQMAGKTGTVQVKSIAQQQEYEEEEVEEKYRDHSLFIAFAPIDDPKIAIAVVVENAGSGSGVAASTARQLIDYYLLDRLNLVEAAGASSI